VEDLSWLQIFEQTFLFLRFNQIHMNIINNFTYRHVSAVSSVHATSWFDVNFAEVIDYLSIIIWRDNGSVVDVILSSVNQSLWTFKRFKVFHEIVWKFINGLRFNLQHDLVWLTLHLRFSEFVFQIDNILSLLSNDILKF